MSELSNRKFLIMETRQKKDYRAPEMVVVKVRVARVLCQSPIDVSRDAIGDPIEDTWEVLIP